MPARGLENNASTLMAGGMSDIKCDISELTGDNFKVWKERIRLHLGWMDIDYTIRKDEPPTPTPESDAAEIKFLEKLGT
ncbi:hypothetical protein LguiB_006144 [Lonicera macranthoides]